MKVDWILLGAVGLLTALGMAVQTRLAGTVPGQSVFVSLGMGLFAGLVAAGLCAGGRAGRALRAWGPWIAWGGAFALMAALLVIGRRYRGGLYCISQPNLGKVRTNLGHGRTKKPPCKVFAGGFYVV